MTTNTEWRTEVCDDCGDEREREWVVKTVWQVEPLAPRGGWRTVSRATGFRTLCACDA